MNEETKHQILNQLDELEHIFTICRLLAKRRVKNGELSDAQKMLIVAIVEILRVTDAIKNEHIKQLG